MSAPKVYQIAEFPNSRYKFDIYDAECKELWIDILNKFKPKGAVGIINLGYFGLSGGGWASGCKIHGEWKCKQNYTSYGICIDKEGNAFVGTGHEENAYSYAEAVPAFTVNGTPSNREQTWGSNGTTALGFKNGNLVCMLCDKDNGQSSKEQIEAMEEYGCETILRMDGSWSSHGCLGFGVNVQPSQMRKDRSYLIIFDKQYVAPRTSKKVTIDPQGVGDAVKYKNTFDICDEIKKALEETEGIECMITRYRDKPDLSNTIRASQSDMWKTDLIYSVNVNEGSSSGSTTYSWSGKETSNAFKFANKILALMKSAGIKTTDAVKIDSADPVLAKSKACAARAMFVGDYSTPQLRFKAVEVSVKAICQELGVTYIPLKAPEVEEVVTPSTGPDYDPFNSYPDKDVRANFLEFRKAGFFDKDVKMGEIVRYGDLTKVITLLIRAIAENSKPVAPEPPKEEEEKEDVIKLDPVFVSTITKDIPNKLKEIIDLLENSIPME